MKKFLLFLAMLGASAAAQAQKLKEENLSTMEAKVRNEIAVLSCLIQAKLFSNPEFERYAADTIPWNVNVHYIRLPSLRQSHVALKQDSTGKIHFGMFVDSAKVILFSAYTICYETGLREPNEYAVWSDSRKRDYLKQLYKWLIGCEAMQKEQNP